MELIIHIESFSYLSYLFEHFIAHLIAIGFVIKSLSYNYKTPNSCLTILCFLIKVGAGGRMWENLVGLDEFSLPL
jgi:hypothetical protein